LWEATSPRRIAGDDHGIDSGVAHPDTDYSLPRWVDAAPAAGGCIHCGIAFRKGGLSPYDIAPILANRLVDRALPSADPDVQDCLRHPNIV
jgi:hypothetical protein